MSGQRVCEWPQGKAWPFRDGKRVVVDESAGTVTFERCHQPRRFWAVRADPTYSCRLDELLAVHINWPVLRHPRHGRDATISTPDGKAVINSRMDGFAEVVEALTRHVGTNRGPLIDNPNAWYAATVALAATISLAGLAWALR